MKVFRVAVSIAVAFGMLAAVTFCLLAVIAIMPTDYIVLAVILAAIGYPVARMCVAEDRYR